jgi:hypothetical protein
VTTDELRAAAERLVSRGSSLPRLTGDWLEMSQRAQSFWADADAVAAAYLTANPADDGEPIDAAWLKNVGFSRHMQPAATNELSWHGGPGRYVTYYPAKNPNDLTLWGVCGEWVPMALLPRTRGDVRRILKALGEEVPS